MPQHPAYLQVKTPWSGKGSFYPGSCKTFSLPRLHLLQPKYLFLLWYGQPEIFLKNMIIIKGQILKYFKKEDHITLLALEHIFMTFSKGNIFLAHSYSYFPLFFYKILGFLLKHKARLVKLVLFVRKNWQSWWRKCKCVQEYLTLLRIFQLQLRLWKIYGKQLSHNLLEMKNNGDWRRGGCFHYNVPSSWSKS